MSKYFISIFLGLLPFLTQAQSEPIDLQQKDTVEYKDPYGLRIGVDLSKLVLSFVDEDYTGLELVGDYRLTRKMYLAAEIGNETKKQSEYLGNTLLYNFETSGSYIKAGVDLNTYTNWYGMNNAITIGGRYAVASFSQTLGDYSIFETERFFNPNFAPGAEPNREFSGLTASWLEFVVGAKVELFANIFIGMSARVGFLVTNTEDEQFPNLWIPGFNKVTDGSNFGVSYNYSISYFLPLYKKSRNNKTAETSEQ